MLTRSYAQTTTDPAMLWANLHEWILRENAYREAHPDEVPGQVALAEMVPARDAGDVCGVCGQLVTWVDHLPPEPGGVVRCFVNVVHLPPVDVEIDDIFPRV